MAVSALCPLSLQTIFDVDGVMVRPARLFFYKPNTLDPIVVYTDTLLSVAHQQPVQTTGAGRVPPIYVGPDPYRIRIYDQYGQLLEDLDGIAGATTPSDGGGGGGGGEIDPNDVRILHTGQMIFEFATGSKPGFVRGNGRTIGNDVSGATERANLDCEDLFKKLWGMDSEGFLAVTGGKGPSADGDWDAGKTIALPDLRGRPPVGLDTMGAPNANRLAGGLFAVGDGTKLGSSGGKADHILLAAEIAKHPHGASFLGTEVPDHNHGGNTGQTDPQEFYPSEITGPTVSGAAPINTTITQTQNNQRSINHSHSIPMGGKHTPAGTVTVSPQTEGDGAHNNLSPFLLLTCYIKL